MSLEFEQLTDSVLAMAREMHNRRQVQAEELAKALRLMRTYASEWSLIEERLERAMAVADEKFYRSARPLHHELPLDQGIESPPPPQQATIVATDGSQIVPDRHAPFLYYLINVGVISYYHGSGRPPAIASVPALAYPGDADSSEDDAFAVSSNLVSIARDRAEILTLLRKVAEAAGEAGPTLGLLDQRLLYWPIGGDNLARGRRVVEEWQEAMSALRAAGGWLAGFIDRPGKRSVLALLHTLDLDQSGASLSDLYRFDSPLYAGLTDMDLFDAFLEPGQRSVVFVDVSHHNRAFAGRDPLNEVCFFYLKTGPVRGQLARVDVPRWVADDKVALGQLHALLVDQCSILGSYPYVITRADEIAVVGRRDQDELENRIALRLAELDIHTAPTAKQQAKNLARTTKTRFEG